jgi:hypothetical protein
MALLRETRAPRRSVTVRDGSDVLGPFSRICSRFSVLGLVWSFSRTLASKNGAEFRDFFVRSGQGSELCLIAQQ